MSDPPRLVEKGATAFQSSLLKAARGPEPSMQARRRTLAALGLAGGVVASGKAAAFGTTVAIWKWAALGTFVTAAIAVPLVVQHRPSRSGGAVGGVRAAADSLASRVALTEPRSANDEGRQFVPAPPIETTTRRTEPGESPSPSAVTSGEVRRTRTPDAQPAEATSPTTTGSTERSAAVTPAPEVRVAAVPETPMTAPTSASSTVQSNSIAAEMAALEAVRNAIDSGRLRDVTSLLEAYRAQFPHGVLGTEATMLQIDALYRSNDWRGAQAMAQQFLELHPNSPHARRLRNMLVTMSGAKEIGTP